MSTVSGNGDSFGLFQMRRPYHCCLPFMAQDAAFNADYYGGILRSYYDGKQTWLNTVERGRQYKAGDVWGSVGAWFSGRWYVNVDDYLSKVRTALREEDVAHQRLHGMTDDTQTGQSSRRPRSGASSTCASATTSRTSTCRTSPGSAAAAWRAGTARRARSAGSRSQTPTPAKRLQDALRSGSHVIRREFPASPTARSCGSTRSVRSDPVFGTAASCHASHS